MVQGVCGYSYNNGQASSSSVCECGISGGVSGHCPYASGDAHFEYGFSLKELMRGMDYCHTKDRENLIAYGECGY